MRWRLHRLDIDVRTQHNRMNRIAGRADDTKVMVRPFADEAKQEEGAAERSGGCVPRRCLDSEPTRQ